jgi:hypothetical protein
MLGCCCDSAVCLEIACQRPSLEILIFGSESRLTVCWVLLWSWPAVCYIARLLLWKLSRNCLSTWFGTQAHRAISESVPRINLIDLSMLLN